MRAALPVWKSRDSRSDVRGGPSDIRVGGACTLEQPFGDERWVVSPCAYLVGLLHPLVIDELDLRRHGFRVSVADPHLWCPFEDGSALALWDDPDR